MGIINQQGRAVCAACRQRHVARNGLCWKCLTDSEARTHGTFCPDRRFNRRGAPVATMDAAEPTDTRPGTCDKIDVLCGRAERGERLWHPLDQKVPSWSGIVLLLSTIHKTATHLGECAACHEVPVKTAYTGSRWLCRECFAETVLGMVRKRHTGQSATLARGRYRTCGWRVTAATLDQET